MEQARTQSWGHHAWGTARIGAYDDPETVLDGDFRVRGVPGLRVVDASVFPGIRGPFIASAVYLASEKTTETLLTEHPADRPPARAHPSTPHPRPRIGANPRPRTAIRAAPRAESAGMRCELFAWRTEVVHMVARTPGVGRDSRHL